MSRTTQEKGFQHTWAYSSCYQFEFHSSHFCDCAAFCTSWSSNCRQLDLCRAWPGRCAASCHTRHLASQLGTQHALSSLAHVKFIQIERSHLGNHNRGIDRVEETQITHVRVRGVSAALRKKLEMWQTLVWKRNASAIFPELFSCVMP